MKNHLKVGDFVRIINHKFPGLHPPGVLSKTVNKTPEEMEEIQEEVNPEKIIHFRKGAIFEYKLSGINYIGMEGVIEEIRTIPEVDYEKETGDIARYVIRMRSNLSNWNNKIVTLYPSQVMQINRLKYKEPKKVKIKKSKNKK